MLKKILCYLILSVLIFSCAKQEPEKLDDNIVVSLNGEYIYKKDIVKILPKNVSAQDSAVIVSNYIENWLIERLLYRQAVMELKDTAIIVDKVNNYRRQLYIHYYVENNINTAVNYNITEEEITDYYNKHLDQYVLPTTYVKTHYLTMDSQIPTYYDVLEKIRNSTLEDEEMLRDYCIGTTRRVYFEKDWIALNEFLNSISYPYTLSDHELSYTSMLDYVNGELRYLVKIDEYVLKGETSPVDLVRDDIIQIIIEHRKRDKYIQVKNNLIEDAVKSGVVTLI